MTVEASLVADEWKLYEDLLTPELRRWATPKRLQGLPRELKDKQPEVPSLPMKTELQDQLFQVPSRTGLLARGSLVIERFDLGVRCLCQNRLTDAVADSSLSILLRTSHASVPCTR